LLLALIYRAVARLCAAYIRLGNRRLSVYVRGSFANADTVPGLTDLDLVVVTPDDPTGATRRRTQERIAALSRSLPIVGKLIDRWPRVLDEPWLLATAYQSTLTYGIESRSAAYSGPDRDDDRIRVLERPELYGPRRGWKLLAGCDRRPDECADRDRRRVACWLELQNWWRWTFQACIEPDRPGSAYTCAKLIAECVRIWLWLTDGEAVTRRTEALALGRVVLPGEAVTFERAERLLRDLGGAPRAPLDDFLSPFLRLSRWIADELERQLSTAGSTEVRLIGSRDPLLLPHGGLASCSAVDEHTPLYALADWRGLVAAAEPDEAFALLRSDPAEPDVMREVALASRGGPYHTLSAHGLMIRPSWMGGRARLRSVHCKPTDPVSFALADDASSATFPDAPGFSVKDVARRALAEHASLLATPRSMQPGAELGALITAARAALLWEGLAAGDPVLPLTAEATLGLLARWVPACDAVAGAALDAFRRYVLHFEEPSVEVREACRGVALSLPGYAATPR
jgi:predicted nucleotidyltransferase